MNKEQLFYQDHLINQILPFWDAAFDEVYGGVFTCYSNDGSFLVSEDKYTWSQARMLWCLSYLLGSSACKRGLSASTLQTYQRRADALYSFLHDHVLLRGEDEVCAFLLSRDGTHKESSLGGGFYTSFYADCFVVMAYARYAYLTGDVTIANEAMAIYYKMKGILEKGIIKTDPYPLPQGAKAQSVSMILCNTCYELGTCLKALGVEGAEVILQGAKNHGLTILSDFVDQKTMRLDEIRFDDERQDSLLGRHHNPGHAVECMWFCLDALGPEYADTISQIAKRSLALGWDDEYGGLFRYVDREGGVVAGASDEDPFSKLISSSWDYKLWWPHAEALYGCLRFFVATKDPELRGWYDRIKAYTFKTFPAQQGREWIQIRTRDGVGEQKVVALPVKDPYHILRMLLLVIDLLEDREDAI